MKKQHITLRDSDYTFLKSLLSKGTLPVRKQKRAQGLLELHKGKTYVEVADIVDKKYTTVRAWAKKYQANGLSFLDDQPRSGRPVEITGEERAKVTALACSEAPKGYARWSLRLLADKVVELELCEHLSHTQAGNILKKTNSSRTEKDNGASGK